MKIKTVTYARLNNLGNYENERAEVVVELNEGDTVQEALAFARRTVENELGLGPKQTEIDNAIKLLNRAGVTV